MPCTGALHYYIINKEYIALKGVSTMKGWLRLGILFLILTSSIVVVNASAKSTFSCGKIVYIGETVDISACVPLEADTIGWWSNPSVRSSTVSDNYVPISNPATFTVDQTQFGAYTGTWYNVDSSGYGLNKVFIVKAKK
jgi:hypothetical protein